MASQQSAFIGKARYHVQRAEHYQRKAEALEARASANAADDQLAAYLLTHDESLMFPYKQATGNRNAHQQQAIMYGIMALVEKVYEEPSGTHIPGSMMFPPPETPSR